MKLPGLCGALLGAHEGAVHHGPAQFARVSEHHARLVIYGAQSRLIGSLFFFSYNTPLGLLSLVFNTGPSAARTEIARLECM